MLVSAATLAQELADDPSAACAKGGANREFMRPGDTAGKQKNRGIGTADDRVEE